VELEGVFGDSDELVFALSASPHDSFSRAHRSPLASPTAQTSGSLAPPAAMKGEGPPGIAGHPLDTDRVVALMNLLDVPQYLRTCLVLRVANVTVPARATLGELQAIATLHFKDNRASIPRLAFFRYWETNLQHHASRARRAFLILCGRGAQPYGRPLITPPDFHFLLKGTNQPIQHNTIKQ